MPIFDTFWTNHFLSRFGEFETFLSKVTSTFLPPPATVPLVSHSTGKHKKRKGMDSLIQADYDSILKFEDFYKLKWNPKNPSKSISEANFTTTKLKNARVEEKAAKFWAKHGRNKTPNWAQLYVSVENWVKKHCPLLLKPLLASLNQ